MNLFLVGKSAAEYYRQHRSDENYQKAPRVRIPREFSLREYEAAQIAQKLRLTLPLHVGIGSRNKERVTQYCKCHVLHASTLGKHAIAVGNGVFVASPELMFLQAASHLTYPQMLKLGYEICGSYMVDPTAIWGFREAEPLTTAARVGELVARCSGTQGVKLARSCVVALRDGAASPREGELAARLFAPTLRGGYGLKGGLLNQRIDLTDEEQSRLGSNFFKCDICWREKGVAVEYDSNLIHTGANRIADDSERRNGLFIKDVHVVVVTNRQYSTVKGTDAAVGAVAHLAGMKINLTSAQGRLRRKKLLEQLEANDMLWPWGSDDVDAEASASK